MQHRLPFLLLLGTLACACDAVDATRDDGNDLAGGDRGPCPRSEASPIAWDDASELGVSPAEAFAGASGSCQAPFQWDASGSSADVTPVSGSAEMEVELTVDQDSVMLRRFDTHDAGVVEEQCRPIFEAQAELHLRSDDGVFEFHDTVDVASRARGGVLPMFASVALADHEGSLVVELADNERSELSFQLAGADPDGCVGEVSMTVTSSRGNLGMATRGPIGSWSNTGCGLAEENVALDDPFADDSNGSLREMVLARFADLQVPGTWDDGSPTELSLSVEVPGDRVCREATETGAALVPVRVTYATEDGAITEHTTEAATVRVSSLPRRQEPLELWISETLRCADESDSLPYTLADCETLESVELQLGINDEGARLSSGEGLNAYEYHRDGAGNGGADELRVLSLDFGP
jgi:hypothetical protein